MRVGVGYAVADGFAAYASAGFDYAEVVGDVLAPGAEFGAAERLRRASDEHGVPIEAMHRFVPGGIPIVGPDADVAALHRYADHVIDTAVGLGVKVIVLGSGVARRVPPGFDEVRALAQLADFLRHCGDRLIGTECEVSIEHLNRAHGNLLTSFREAALFVASVDHPKVGVVADSYHMQIEQEAVTDLLDFRPVHVHVANLERTGLDADAWTLSFFAALRDIAYDDRVTVECDLRTDSSIGRRAISVVRDALATGHESGRSGPGR